MSGKKSEPRQPSSPANVQAPRSQVARAAAIAYLQGGNVASAFLELARSVTPEVAGVLVRAALRSEQVNAADALLQTAEARASDREFATLRRHRVRLLRKAGRSELAEALLAEGLARLPRDPLLQASQFALLSFLGKWEPLDRGFEEEINASVQEGDARRAYRSALRRALLVSRWSHNPARAALRYGQAVRYAVAAGDLQAAVSACSPWLAALEHAKAPKRARREAAEYARSLADRLSSLWEKPAASGRKTTGEVPAAEEAPARGTEMGRKQTPSMPMPRLSIEGESVPSSLRAVDESSPMQAIRAAAGSRSSREIEVSSTGRVPLSADTEPSSSRAVDSGQTTREPSAADTWPPFPHEVDPAQTVRAPPSADALPPPPRADVMPPSSQREVAAGATMRAPPRADTVQPSPREVDAGQTMRVPPPADALSPSLSPRAGALPPSSREVDSGGTMRVPPRADPLPSSPRAVESDATVRAPPRADTVRPSPREVDVGQTMRVPARADPLPPPFRADTAPPSSRAVESDATMRVPARADPLAPSSRAVESGVPMRTPPRAGALPSSPRAVESGVPMRTPPRADTVRPSPREVDSGQTMRAPPRSDTRSSYQPEPPLSGEPAPPSKTRHRADEVDRERRAEHERRITSEMPAPPEPAGSSRKDQDPEGPAGWNEEPSSEVGLRRLGRETPRPSRELPPRPPAPIRRETEEATRRVTGELPAPLPSSPRPPAATPGGGPPPLPRRRSDAGLKATPATNAPPSRSSVPGPSLLDQTPRRTLELPGASERPRTTLEIPAQGATSAPRDKPVPEPQRASRRTLLDFPSITRSELEGPGGLEPQPLPFELKAEEPRDASPSASSAEARTTVEMPSLAGNPDSARMPWAAPEDFPRADPGFDGDTEFSALGSGAASPRPPEQDARLAELRREEVELVARAAWPELVAHYESWAAAASTDSEALEALSRLAELLENELDDGAAAASIYGQMVLRSGDPVALSEQVRLLSRTDDGAAVERALEVGRLPAEASARADALAVRGQGARARGDERKAEEEFSAALALVPNHLPSLGALAELRAPKGETAALRAFEEALALEPRHRPGRGALYRRLARLAATPPVDDLRAAQSAWAEVALEFPRDSEALAQLASIARRLKDDGGLERALRGQLSREPRGPASRAVRLELVSLLERQGRAEEALGELRQAVRAEPGHKEAWLLLARRLAERGRHADQAWALEQAASAMDDARERHDTWVLLGELARGSLHDLARAALYENRAEAVRQAVPAAGLTDPSTPVAQVEPERIDSSDILEEVELGGPVDTVAPTRTLVSATVARRALLEAVEAEPLRAEGYQALAVRLEEEGAAERASLLREIASALWGTAAPKPLPRARAACDARERGALLHPSLRGEMGALFAAVGPSFARLFGGRSRSSGVRQELRIDGGPGARGVFEALQDVSKLLDLPVPELFLSDDNGPAFALVYAGGPRLMVGRLAARRPHSPVELRFQAGRALFSQSPVLLALRLLKPDQLQRGLSVLASLFRGGRAESSETRVLRSGVGDLEALRQSYARVGRSLDLGALQLAARHSANRAGLVSCSDLAGALGVMQLEQAPTIERVELLRYATSERYFQWWLRDRAATTAR